MGDKVDAFCDDGASFSGASAGSDKGVFMVIEDDFGLMSVERVGLAGGSNIVQKPALELFWLFHRVIIAFE